MRSAGCACTAWRRASSRATGPPSPWCVRSGSGAKAIRPATSRSPAAGATTSAGRSPETGKIARMPSFDIVSQVNQQEVKNAVEQTNKEITNRFDFKGSDARVEQAELVLTVYADDEFKLGQVADVLRGRLAKRNVDVRSLDSGAIE